MSFYNGDDYGGERLDYEDTSNYLLNKAFEEAQQELSRIEWESWYEPEVQEIKSRRNRMSHWTN